MIATKNCLSRVMAVIIAVAMVVVMIPTNITYAASDAKLTVKVDEYGQPKLEWSSVDGADEYEVYRAQDENGTAGEFAYRVNPPGGEPRTYTDYETTAGKTYYYKVVARNAAGEEVAVTNTVSYLEKLSEPYLVAYTNPSSGNPVIEWSGSSEADRYQVWRATSKKGKYTKIATTVKVKYTDKKAKNGKKYYYKVKSIYDANSKVNSKFSNIESAKKIKGDKALAKAINNVPEKKVSTLDDTLSLVSKTDVRNLVGFDGGITLYYEGKLPLRKIYDFKGIIKRGGTVKGIDLTKGSPYYASTAVQPQKDNAKFPYFYIATYGINTFKVKKGTSQKKVISQIKKTAAKYYPTNKWTISVEKYSASKKKFKGEVNNYKMDYDIVMKYCGYQKYQSDKYKYVLTIKNKANKKKQGWTFVTVIPK